jgi:hypothetical protein
MILKKKKKSLKIYLSKFLLIRKKLFNQMSI